MPLSLVVTTPRTVRATRIEARRLATSHVLALVLRRVAPYARPSERLVTVPILAGTVGVIAMATAAAAKGTRKATAGYVRA